MRRRSRGFWVKEFAAWMLLPCVGVASGWAQAPTVQQGPTAGSADGGQGSCGFA